MTIINTFVLEDDKNFLPVLIAQLNQIETVNIVGTSSSIKDAKEKIETLKPELVIFDVCIGNKTSFELLNQLNYLNFNIIFISSFEEYALKAIKWRAFDYLLKPFGQAELKAAILMVLQNKLNLNTIIKRTSLQSNNPLVLKTQSEIHFVLLSEIYYCEGDGNYTTFYLENKTKIVVSSLLKNYEEILSDHGFIRVHKSFLVPISKIKKFDKITHTLVLENGAVIEVSKRKKEELLKTLSYK